MIASLTSWLVSISMYLFRAGTDIVSFTWLLLDVFTVIVALDTFAPVTMSIVMFSPGTATVVDSFATIRVVLDTYVKGVLNVWSLEVLVRFGRTVDTTT